jgi:hypothetical protein
MSKDFVFYSNYCQHSKKLLDMLSKNNMLEHFELCCVDSNDVQLPDFIESVPTLYIVAQKRVLNDAGLFHYINIEMNKNPSNNQLPQQLPPTQQLPPSTQQQQQQLPPSTQQQQQQQQQQLPPSTQPSTEQPKTSSDDDIAGYFNKEMGGSFSDNYSFLEGNQTIEHSYSFIGDKSPQDNKQQQQQQSISQNPNAEQKSSKGALMDKAYEQMMQQRGSEMQKSLGQMRV